MTRLTTQLFFVVLLFMAACSEPLEIDQEGKGGLECLDMEVIPDEEIAKKEVVLGKRPKINLNTVKIGQTIDQINGVPIYYNGRTLHTRGRHVSKDGYNYGLKWQCVEFIKRYYYDFLQHKMPDTFGHAKDFFLNHLEDGQINPQRNLYQFKNGGVYQPQVHDILVFVGDEYGHVAIISQVTEDAIDIIQQNVGIATRHRLKLLQRKGRYYVMNKAVIGWLGQRDM